MGIYVVIDADMDVAHEAPWQSMLLPALKPSQVKSVNEWSWL